MPKKNTDLKREIEAMAKCYLGLRTDRRAPEHLHHCTKPESLRKILKSGKLRLYDAWSMEGDPEEIRYPMQKVWDSMQPCYGQLPYRLTDSFKPANGRLIEGYADLLICCFCQAKESRHMWMKYAAEGTGASLAVKTATLPRLDRGICIMMYRASEYNGMLARFCKFLSNRDWSSRFDYAEGNILGEQASLYSVFEHGIFHKARKIQTRTRMAPHAANAAEPVLG